MTALKQKLGAVVVLAGVSVVSLLAGSVLLGAASAEEDTRPPSSGTSYRLADADESGSAGGTACIIAFGHGQPPQGSFTKTAEAPNGSRIEIGRSVDANGQVTAWKLIDGQLVEGKLPEAGLPTPSSALEAIKSKTLSAEEIERLEAAGKAKFVMPVGCTVVDPLDLPEGETPGKPAIIAKDSVTAS